jgi:alkanesulfonate monooxygenase SsuD/methylene tetrahydromethanopterin reductase-like flavin-dependent oxidoreductase (luciferase family)
LVTIGAMAAVTSRLRFSTIVYILPLRHPLEVAKQCATLAVLSDNRFALGVGSGWMKEEFDTLAIEFKARGRRYDEMLDIMRALWADGEVEYHGTVGVVGRFELPNFSGNQFTPPTGFGQVELRFGEFFGGLQNRHASKNTTIFGIGASNRDGAYDAC